MGFLDRFRRKKKDDLVSDIEKIKEKEVSAPTEKPVEQAPVPKPQLAQVSEFENIRAKIDLVLTEIDSLKAQNHTMNERLKSIEKSLADMKGIRYY